MKIKKSQYLYASWRVYWKPSELKKKFSYLIYFNFHSLNCKRNIYIEFTSVFGKINAINEMKRNIHKSRGFMKFQKTLDTS